MAQVETQGRNAPKALKAPTHPKFTDHYRDHAVPQLIRLTKAEAVCVARGVETFNDAFDVIMHHARILGALNLGNEELLKLEDFILTKLAKEIDANV